MSRANRSRYRAIERSKGGQRLIFVGINRENLVEPAHAEKLAVSSTKSLTGHLIAGAGAVEAAICALAIDRSLLPPSANIVEDDPDCDLDFVRDQPRPARIGIAISNSFGFGGSNSCVVLRNPDEVDA